MSPMLGDGSPLVALGKAPAVTGVILLITCFTLVFALPSISFGTLWYVGRMGVLCASSRLAQCEPVAEAALLPDASPG